MATFYKTIIVSNGNFIYSDKRLAIKIPGVTAGVVWDGSRVLENLTSSGLFLTNNEEEKQKIGKVISLHELAYSASDLTLSKLIDNVVGIKLETPRTIQESIAYIEEFNLGLSKKKIRLIGITENGYSFEISSGVEESPTTIQIFEPGVLRIYVGQTNSPTIDRFTEVFKDQRVDEEFTKNAFLAISAINQGSVNYDKMSHTGEFRKNVKPTIEEEKEALGIFFHPKYKQNRPAKRLWNN